MAPRLRSYALNALLFALILGGAAVLGFVPYRLEVRAARHEVQRKVLAVGRLKADAIGRWLQERRMDLEGSATGPAMALEVERWTRTGRIDPAGRAWVAARLERLRELGGYAEASLTQLDGAALLSVGAPEAPMPGLRPDDVRRAVATRSVVFSPLARLHGAAGDRIVLDVIAPLVGVDAGGSRVVGGLVFRIDPRDYLFPLVQSWPTDNHSAESLLVERDGDRVLFLNDLRHRKGTALDLRLSAADPGLLAAKAVRGERGLIEGTDYRGVPVLGWVEAVEGSPWILVTKIDQAEIYAPLRDYLWVYLAFLALAAVTAGVTTVMRQRALSEASARREHEATKRYVDALVAAEAERERLIASLRKALDEVKTLRGIVPICASCKRIRDDAGFWKQVEAFVSEHTEAQFSHGVCPDCYRRLYPDLGDPEEPAKPGG